MIQRIAFSGVCALTLGLVASGCSGSSSNNGPPPNVDDNFTFLSIGAQVVSPIIPGGLAG